MKREFSVNEHGVVEDPEEIRIAGKKNEFEIVLKVACVGGYWYYGRDCKRKNQFQGGPCCTSGVKYTTRTTALIEAAHECREHFLKDPEDSAAAKAVQALNQFVESLSQKDPSDSKDVGTTTESQGFDYSSLTEEEADVARRSVELIRVRLRRTAEDIVEIGRELARVKDALPHGKFLPWIQSEFEMSERTAQNFIRVAAKFGKSAKLADLKPSVLYLLAEDSTPDSVRDQAIEKSESGEKVTLADVQKWKTEATEAKKREAQLTKQVKEMKRDLVATDTQNIELRKELDHAKSRPPRIEERVVPPADYDQLKRQVEQLREQILDNARTFAQAQECGDDTDELQARIERLEAEMERAAVQGKAVQACEMLIAVLEPMTIPILTEENYETIRNLGFLIRERGEAILDAINEYERYHPR